MRPSLFFIHSHVPRDTLVTKTQSKRVCTLLHILYNALPGRSHAFDIGRGAKQPKSFKAHFASHVGGPKPYLRYSLSQILGGPGPPDPYIQGDSSKIGQI